MTITHTRLNYLEIIGYAFVSRVRPAACVLPARCAPLACRPLACSRASDTRSPTKSRDAKKPAEAGCEGLVGSLGFGFGLRLGTAQYRDALAQAIFKLIEGFSRGDKLGARCHDTL